MKELSIFIDESGDFGEYDYHSPWYIVTMVFHEQEASIQEPMEYLMILSILVDTFISKISFPMQPGPEIGSISDA